MESRKCTACGRKFKKRSHGRQSYCSEAKCQRERRRRWQNKKRKSDPDYKDNQSRAQQAWIKRNPSYWTEYRQKNPEYSSRNRRLQQERRQNKKTAPVAKMDVAEKNSQIPSGTYLLIPASINGVAKMDVWTVEIKFISTLCEQPTTSPDDCKERT